MRLPTAERSRVVLIGTAHYDDADLPDLSGVSDNVTDLEQRLIDERHGAFRAVRTVLDPHSLVDVGPILAEEAELAEDTLFVYYAGHGLVDRRGELYLALRTTTSRHLDYTAMPFELVRRAFLDSPASNRVLILDCCFSGRAIDAMTDPASVVSGQIDITGTYTLTSSSANETSRAPDGARHTSFTGELLDLLSHGSQRAGELITLDEMYHHLVRTLSARGLPKPQRRGTGTAGQLALSRNPAWSATITSFAAGIESSLPSAIRGLVASDDPQDRQHPIGELGRLLSSRNPEVARAAFTVLSELVTDDNRAVSEVARATLADFRRTPATTQSALDLGRLAPTRGRQVGIDLGTTNSVIAVLEGGEPTVIPNAEGSRTTPSVVAFARNGEVLLVGEVAKRQATTNVDRTIRSVKRHMGENWSKTIGDKTFTAQQISAFVLQKLKRDAEAYLGEQVTDAVITVPAYFSDAQRQATKEAGEIAGLNVQLIINEPTAVALAYGLDKGSEQTVLMLHLGGATYNASLLQAGAGRLTITASTKNLPQSATRSFNELTRSFYERRWMEGNLGGDDWDRRIVEWLVSQFKNKTGTDLSGDKMAMQRVQEAAEKAKIELSSAAETIIRLPYLSLTDSGPLHLEENLSRTEFHQMTNNRLSYVTAPIVAMLEHANVSNSDIDHVILIGGSTRMPAIADAVKE